VETRNVTLSLPKDVLRQVKIVAAQRGTSVSRLLTDALRDLVSSEAGYASAAARHGALLRRPPDLGTRGRRRWSRDDLHER
jgi:metal-responsive CopG/Arc/MetJ family transcriptional regulator